MVRGPKKERRVFERQRGFTLIEVIIALSIAALMVGMAAMSVNAVTDAHLRSASVTLAGAIKMTYDRAIMQKRNQRIAFDLDKGAWWIEFSQTPFALKKEKERGESGERDRDVDENDSSRRRGARDEDTSEVERILDGSARAFLPDLELDAGKPQRLGGDVGFARIWTSHQEEWFSSGMAYIHFFASGFAEPGIVELVDEGGDTMSLKVEPLTGRVEVSRKRLEIPDSRDDDREAEGDE